MQTHHTHQSDRAAVYVLQRFDRQRFKVGWALEPMQRIAKLPEFDARQLDLDHSVALWVPTRQRAEQIERAVHKSLAPYVSKPGHRRTGHTEWFESDAHSMAMRMLVQMPGNEGADARVGLTPLTQQPQGNVPRETGPQETWWALEDLWTRLSMCTALTIERDGDCRRLILPAFRNAHQGALAELRHAVFDTETYTWRNAGQRGEFVSLIDYRGDDLVCTLTGSRRIEAWPDGEELVWQVKSFLLRLVRSTAVRRCA
jgi:hypothetical protein